MYTPIKRMMCLLFIFLSSTTFVFANSKTIADYKPINSYIHESWQRLARSLHDCKAYQDNKVAADKILYLPYNYPAPFAVKQLAKSCNITITYLPRAINHLGDIKTDEIQNHGLLYLPYEYVVPGGRFNEMYGWDSYFIILGLLHDNEYRLANNMLENYFFEIKYYGSILNANRTYHLSRSQPPFLTSAIIAVYNASHKNDLKWLTRAYKYAKHDYMQWVSTPFLAGKTSLSRFYDYEQNYLIEEKVTNDYYKKVQNYITAHPLATAGYISPEKTLSPDYFHGERSLRASGFDITFRFGPFGGRTHHYAPVCLNSLLYKTEKDLKLIAQLLGKTEEANLWQLRADTRRNAMQKYMWNAKLGLFVDYDFVNDTQSDYKYATTFYPLWAGVATNSQADRIRKNLAIFSQPGGLAMSEFVTGAQWDKPYGWAPIHLLAVLGLERYGFNREATQIATRFDHTIWENFMKTGKIFEKYDVVNRTHQYKINIGYNDNVIGFGWTNATFVLLEDLLTKGKINKI